MQAFCGKDVGLDPLVDRHQRECSGTDLIRQRRHAERDAFAGEPVGLAVEGLVLAVLLEQQHGEEAGAGPPARYDVERCRRLTDLLAVPAGELRAHGLDHLPRPRDHFQRLGDVLAQLRQLGATTGQARTGGRHDDAFARQVLGERLTRRRLALEAAHAGGLLGRGLGNKGVFAGVGFEFLELQLHLVEQAARAFGAGAVLLALELGDLQLQMRDQRRGGALAGRRIGEPGFGGVGAGNGRCNQRLERFDVVGQGGNGGDHEAE